ncbi:MAG: YfhO family protein [Lachnospiraceae bacterium]|nr:YfhO family protein [Lachnospiraceae bacterium]MDD7026666.1 YfhO family protein [Lachnospiraceae bacterium]
MNRIFDNKFTRFTGKNAIYITAFFIPVSLMLIIFMVRGVYPFGDRSFLHVDMYHQYFPFLNEMYDKLNSKDSLLFSWNTGLGSNFLALFVYYLSSPFNWLAVLIPESLLIEFQTYLVVFKIGLTGFSSCYYFHHHFKKKRPSLLFFSTFYALSGFMAAYNWNVMWLDVVMLAPLVILGLEKLVQEGRYRLYCISLTIAILSNYYLCIMLCIYLVLYFLLVLLPAAPKKLRACRQFAVCSLLAGGMGAVLLIPELAALSLTEFSGSPFPSDAKAYFAIFDVLARHCVDVAVELGLDHWPNLYCGAAVLVLVPLYVVCKTIPSRQKIGKLSLLCLLLISFSSNTLSFLWHGFNYPNSLPSRQSYLYILLVLTIALETFYEIREISKRDISQVFMGVVIFLVLCQKLVSDDAFTNRSFLLTFVFLLGYAFLIQAYRNIPQATKPLLCLALALVMLESGLNTFLTSCPTVSRSQYLSDYDSYELLVKRRLTKENDFKRFERDSRVTNNDGMLFGYPSASYFSSTGNGLVNAFYEEYGLKSSKVFYSFDGATPFTRALLNVPYTISKSENEESPLQKLVDQEGNLYLYEHSATLPFGYFVPALDLSIQEAAVMEDLENSAAEEAAEQESEPSLYELTELFVDSMYAKDVVLDDTLNTNRSLILPVEAQNQLAKKLGATEEIFSTVAANNRGSTATLTIPEDGYYYGYSKNSRVASASMRVTSPSGETVHEAEFKKMKNRHILDFGYRKAGERISITAADNLDLLLEAYALNEKPFLALIEALGNQPLELTSFTSTKVTGNIEVKEAGYLILSMPYEPGWTILVNGKEVEPQLFEGMFMSIPMAQGMHTVSLSFVPKGFYAGILLSLISLLLFLLYAYGKSGMNALRRRKQN